MGLRGLCHRILVGRDRSDCAANRARAFQAVEGGTGSQPFAAGILDAGRGCGFSAIE